jgi:hypothetical protein
MDFSTNEHLQEVCDVKQPILFNYRPFCPEFFDKFNVEVLDDINNPYDLKIKESIDYWKEDNNTIDYVVLPFQSGATLMSSDTNSQYFTENNAEFIEDAGLCTTFALNDVNFKPTMNAQIKYDIWMGSKNVCTPLRYHTNFRQFVCVNSGSIQIKMTPWKSRKYLYPVHDYDSYEFRSPINVWNPQHKYRHEMDKIKFLEFEVNAGYVLYIPPFWWFSIKYSENPNNLISCFTYNSIMNCISNIPNWGLYYLQQNNTNKKIVKTKDVVITDNTSVIVEDNSVIVETKI